MYYHTMDMVYPGNLFYLSCTYHVNREDEVYGWCKIKITRLKHVSNICVWKFIVNLHCNKRLTYNVNIPYVT